MNQLGILMIVPLFKNSRLDEMITEQLFAIHLKKYPSITNPHNYFDTVKFYTTKQCYLDVTRAATICQNFQVNIVFIWE